MYVKQISVFVENKPGRILEIIETLGKNNIDICGLSVADTSEFGVARMIVSDSNLAKTVLRENGVIVKITDITAIAVDNKPGALTDALRILKENNIVVEYMYAIAKSINEKSVIVIRADVPEKAEDALKANGVKVLSHGEINNL